VRKTSNLGKRGDFLELKRWEERSGLKGGGNQLLRKKTGGAKVGRRFRSGLRRSSGLCGGSPKEASRYFTKTSGDRQKERRSKRSAASLEK